MTKLLRTLRLLPLLLAAAPLAQAHPGHAPFDFISGLIHPLTGWDHLVAMIGVGLWAAQLGGRARWALPAAFVGAMLAGAAGGVLGFAPPGVEVGIIASVLAVGLLVAGAARLPLAAGVALVAAAGLCHGAAHGAEMPLRADSLQFLGGLIAATVGLHALGLGTGSVALRRDPALVRWAGAGIVGAGVALLLA
jgi:urease accessory protein